MKLSTEHIDFSYSTALGKILNGNRAEDSMLFKYKQENNNEIKKKKKKSLSTEQQLQGQTATISCSATLLP